MKKILILSLLFIPFINPLGVGEAYQNPQTEIVSKRTENTKVFDNHNGTKQYIIHSGPIHYQDENNNWQEIDTAIQPSSKDADFEMTKSMYKAWFKKTFNTEGIVKMEKEGRSITVTPGDLSWTNDSGEKQLISTPQPVEGEAKEREITYKNAYGKGLDFIYQTFGIKLEKRLIIPEFKVLPQPNQEILNGKNPSIELNLSFETDATVQIYVDGKPWNQKTIKTQSKIEFIKDGKLLWYFAPPKAWDKVENKVAGSVILSSNQNNKYSLSILFPFDWLKTTEGPITLDPTNYYASTTDGWIQGLNVDYATSRLTSDYLDATSVYFYVGQFYNPTTTKYSPNRGFVEFDTSGIVDTDIVTQVNLYLKTYSDSSATDFDVRVHKYNWSSPLSEANKESNYDGALASAYDNLWQNTSGLSLNTYYGSSNLTTSWVSKTGVTQYALLSSRDINSNAPTGNEYYYFYSAENAGTTSDPYLAITTISNNSPTNDSLTFTNPYGGSGNDAIADNTTEWNFRAVVSDLDGYTNLGTVVLRLANSSDNTTPFDALKFTWTESTDAFSETADTQNAATITSTSTDSSCATNTCTLDFKIKFNNSFSTQSTNYNAELYTTDDFPATDEDSYTSFYQVISGVGTLLSTPIYYASFEGAKHWQYLKWNDDETTGDIKYQVYYDVSGTATIVPDSDLTGNSAGFDTSPVSLSGLSTTTYPILYTKATLTYIGGSPKLNDWGINYFFGPTLDLLMRHGKWFDLGVKQKFWWVFPQ